MENDKKKIADYVMNTYSIEVTKERDRFSCYIPKFDLYFSSKNESEIKKKGRFMVISYVKMLHELNANKTLLLDGI